VTFSAGHMVDGTEGSKAAHKGLRTGDAALIGILASDFFGALAGATVYMTMVWWVLAQGTSDLGITLLVMSIFVPLNIGVIASGVAVARFGARRLLLFSKSLAVVGAIACATMLATDAMTLWSLALLATLVYGAMGPSMTADVSRAPALTRLANRKLASFHAVNGTVMVSGQLGGLTLGGMFATASGSATAVAFGACLVGLSLMATWLSFPRDRLQPKPSMPATRQVIYMTQNVLSHLDGKKIGLLSISISVAYIVVAEGYAEVLLPLELKDAGLPPTDLSLALGLSTVASVFAMLWAQAVHGKVALRKALAFVGVAMVVLLLIAMSFGGWIAMVIAVSTTTAAASGSATLTFTTLQLSMPQSLQAQAAGLWQSFVLTSSALVMFLCGMIGPYGFVTLFALTTIATLASFWRGHND